MKIVSTKSTDGIEFKGLLSEAENAKGIIIHVHGMAGNVVLNSFYPAMHEEYPKAGWSFLVGENRGSESLKEVNTDEGFKYVGNSIEIFEECVYDIQGWIDFAKSKGYTRIWLQAHSLGPSKITYYVTTQQNNIEGLIYISPSDMIGLIKDSEGKKFYDLLMPEAQKLLSEGKDKTILSNPLWDAELLSAQTFNNFFGENSKLGIFNYGVPELGWEVLNSVKLPVIAFTGTKDSGVVSTKEPHEAMKMLEEQLKLSPRKKTVVFDGAQHDFEGFDKEIISNVLDFISN